MELSANSGQAEDWGHLSHLTTCIWLVIALIHTGSVSLTKWVTQPCRGVFAQRTQHRIQRWLYNPRINIHRLYKPLIQAALADWTDKLKSNSWIYRIGKGWCQLKDVHFNRRNNINGKVWAIASDEPTTLNTNSFVFSLESRL
jgi:hypothetical protein